MFTQLLAEHFVHTALWAGAVVGGRLRCDRRLRRGARDELRGARDLGARLHRRRRRARARDRPGARDPRRLAARRTRARAPLPARARAGQRDRRGARVRPRRRRPLPLALPGLRDRGDEPPLRQHRRRLRRAAAEPRDRRERSCSSALALLYRPLLFSSVDPEIAAARGVPLRALSVAIFLLLALTTAEAIQVVGVLLVLTLVITPAAAAQRLTGRPALALAAQRRDRARLDRGRDPALAREVVADELLHRHDLVRRLRRGAGLRLEPRPSGPFDLEPAAADVGREVAGAPDGAARGVKTASGSGASAASGGATSA